MQHRLEYIESPYTNSIYRIYKLHRIYYSVDSSSSAHTDNRKKDILMFGQDSTGRSDNTAVSAKAKYSVNVIRLRKKIR